MAPPKLPRDAPILYIFEPAVPIGLGMFGVDDQLPRLRALFTAMDLIEGRIIRQGCAHLDRLFGENFAVHPPLWF